MRRTGLPRIVLATALSCGCVFVSKIHVTVEPGSGTPPDVTADDPRLVGVALSGGGSRASVYAAAGLEALWEHGLLDEVDYVSSVSGGSIAASYFVKHVGHDREAIDEPFFERFRAAMRENLWRAIERRQCARIRWTSSTRRATSLAEVLDRRFLDGLTVGDLHGASPVWLVNTTLFDNGRRFVVTTVDQGDLELSLADASGPERTLADRPALEAMTFTHPRVLGGVPRSFPVALAVAASASVPLLIGPVTIRVGDDYWHLGDGGLYDNTGVETLEHLFLRQMQAGKTVAPATILALDAGMWWDFADLVAERNFWVSEHAYLLADIPMARAEAYHEVTWTWLAIQGDEPRIERRFMRYTTADLSPELLPSSCNGEPDLCTEASCRESLRRHVARIPTHLRISECDADLMELAAHAVVHRELSDSHPPARACRLGIEAPTRKENQ